MLLAVATALEGHADNAAPALFGGLTSVLRGGAWRSGGAALDVARRAAAGRGDAGGRSGDGEGARGAARSRCRGATRSSTCSGCCRWCTRCSSGDYDRLREAVQDRWHQPARAALVPLLARGAGARGSRRARGVPVGRRAVGGAARAAAISSASSSCWRRCTSAPACRSTVRTLTVHHAPRAPDARARPCTGETV